MKRKLLGLLFSFCMAAALLPGTAFAAEEAADTWNGTADTSWYDPNDIKAGYEILTAEELAGLALLVNDGTDFASTVFTLKTDIDLSGQEWISIGNGNNAAGYFAGVFDGEYHVISNMKTGKINHGLFGIVSGGTVQNLGVEDADITFTDGDSSLRAGVLMDWAHNATIKNCYTTGKIVTNALGSKNIGGIAGQGMYGTKIIGCYSSAVIESKAFDSSEAVGGIVGSWETKGEQPMIADCYFDGEILFHGGPVDNQDPTANNGMSNSVGGILGMCFDNEPDLIIKNCMVAAETVEAPSDYNIEAGNGGMWIAWYQMTGMPENCYWPLDGRGWPACIAFETYALSGGTDGLYFEECGTPTTDFKDPSILRGLQANAQPGVTWVAGMEHPTFAWDDNNIPASYQAVDEAIEKAEALDADLYVNYADVASAVEEVDRTKSKAEQALVNEMAQNILEAIDALEYKPASYDQVRTAIGKAEALNQEEYKDFSGVEAAVKAVVWDKNITEQAEVNAMAKAIEDAVAALEYKPADYSGVDAAIGKAEALNQEEYKDFSGVEAAVKAVVWDKNITEQAEVDAMAKAIEEAIEALEKKPVPPETPSGSGEPETGMPATGDASSTAVWMVFTLLGMVGFAAAGTMAFKRKKVK